jgi:hypothetical protein
MKFSSEIFSRKAKCFRASWGLNHFLTYDGENFIEHLGKSEKIWCWQTSKEIEKAVEDLTADDWRYIEN